MVIMKAHTLIQLRDYTMMVIVSPFWIVIGVLWAADWMFNIPRVWTKWFAWYPVRCQNGDIVWLETIERVDYVINGVQHRRITAKEESNVTE